MKIETGELYFHLLLPHEQTGVLDNTVGLAKVVHLLLHVGVQLYVLLVKLRPEVLADHNRVKTPSAQHQSERTKIQ